MQGHCRKNHFLQSNSTKICSTLFLNLRWIPQQFVSSQDLHPLKLKHCFLSSSFVVSSPGKVWLTNFSWKSIAFLQLGLEAIVDSPLHKKKTQNVIFTFYFLIYLCLLVHLSCYCWLFNLHFEFECQLLMENKANFQLAVLQIEENQINWVLLKYQTIPKLGKLTKLHCLQAR